MKMDILNLLRDLGVFAFATWGIQLIISKSADRKFESYKLELDNKSKQFQASLDSKMELYKAELNLQNYKSTQIYEKQLNVIIELHVKLVTLNRLMQEMTAFFKPAAINFEELEKEKMNLAGEAYNDFMLFYSKNTIFIPQKTTEKIDKIRNDYFSSYMDYTFGKRNGLSDKFSVNSSIEAGNTVKDKIQPALIQLTLDFRELIGTEDNKKNAST